MKTVLTGHPDFMAAPERHRYTTGSLRGLFVFLDYESRDRQHGEAWRVLQDGTRISVRRTERDSRVLRIERPDKPVAERWEDQVHDVAARCGLSQWHRVDDTTAPGRAVEFHEVQPGARCKTCDELLPEGLVHMSDVCPGCSIDAMRGAATRAFRPESR